jgi:hypothetical protein
MPDPHLQSNLATIAAYADEHVDENDRFKAFLKQQDDDAVDKIVFELNDHISPQIDCMACGNCCKSFMINVTQEEAENLSTHLQMPLPQLKEKYLEESAQGQMVVNTIPCSFLTGTVCSIYEYRFDGCREFPHLHRPHFNGRLFGVLMYYATCPIIFNVIEELKVRTNFKQKDNS